MVFLGIIENIDNWISLLDSGRLERQIPFLSNHHRKHDPTFSILWVTKVVDLTLEYKISTDKPFFGSSIYPFCHYFDIFPHVFYSGFVLVKTVFLFVCFCLSFKLEKPNKK